MRRKPLLLLTALLFIAGCALGFLSADALAKWFTSALGSQVKITALSVTEPFVFRCRTAGLTGLLFASGPLAALLARREKHQILWAVRLGMLALGISLVAALDERAKFASYRSLADGLSLGEPGVLLSALPLSSIFLPGVAGALVLAVILRLASPAVQSPPPLPKHAV